MIVVVGSPVLRRAAGSVAGDVGGLAGAVALAAAAAERTVQLVGKVGDDDGGDALLMALTRGGIGHAALLRDAANATPIAAFSTPRDGPADDAPFGDDPGDGAPPLPDPVGLPLEAGDIQLALRYLTDFRVVVIAAPLDPASLRATFEAASFAGAHVIRVDAPGAALAAGVVSAPGTASAGAAAPADSPTDGIEMTAFEAPNHDEPAFAAMIARYAAGLDAGRSSRDAFADATRAANWERSAPD